MKIYAYYQSIATADQSEEFGCANLWKQSWEQHGWSPILLNRSHAQASMLYSKLQKKLISEFRQIPQELSSRIDWISARFVRWCALHAAGGGWLSDYDVINKGFKPEIAEDYQKTEKIYLDPTEQAHLIYVSADHIENCIKKIIHDPMFFKNVLIFEGLILQSVSSSNKIKKLIQHVACKDGKTRSQLMKEIIESKGDSDVKIGRKKNLKKILD